MKEIIDFLRTSYKVNKIVFLAAVVVIALFVVGCSASSSGAAPAGPVGGGCGG